MTDGAGFMMTTVTAMITVDGVERYAQLNTPSRHVDELHAVGVDIAGSMRERVLTALVEQMRADGIPVDPASVTFTCHESWFDLSDD